MSQADIACHVAKTHGRNCIHVYRQGDAELIRRHGDVHMVPSINHAISEDRFLLMAQPIMPIAAGKSATPHFEILVRMLDEHGNIVIPGEFVPAAERYTLMPAVDRWVVNRLFARQWENLQTWSRKQGDTFLFAVNLSATSLMDHGFLGYLKRQFTNWNVPFSSICFEITETAAISRLDQAKRFIEELKSAGCSFALDDFGTGLSSYTYLKELAVDYLKIDGGFVRNMADDPVDHAMVDSINQIGHILGLETIAEWAEDQHTLNQLRALNVDYAQGYGVGKIIALDDFELSDIPPAVQLHTNKRNERLVKLIHSGLRPA
jgi:EAL domain-containing protein (putative c-di-GMP-specific phosphodiesterase class I)